MKLHKILLAVIILSSLMFTCSCWNYSDLEKKSLVSGFSIDKTPSGEYLVTVEVIDFETTGIDAKQTGKNIETQGKTLFEAIRKVINLTGYRLYWAHANIVVVGQEVAKEGLADALDFISRDAEVREEMYVIISREKTAKEILEQQMLLSQTSANNIEKMLGTRNRDLNSPSIQAYQLINILEEEGISPCLPAIRLTENEKKRTAELYGAAVFKEDKLIGYLNPEETNKFLFITDKVRKGIMTFKMEDSDVTLEIQKAKTKIRPEINKNRLKMKIDIKIEGSVAELETTKDLLADSKFYKLEKQAEDDLRNKTEELIKKVKRDFGSDIFGFGKYVKAYLPSVWRASQDKKVDLFSQIEPEINVNIILTGSGLNSKTVKKRV